MRRDSFPRPRPEFAGLQHGPQARLWPDEPCGHAIYQPEQAELFGPEVVALDCDSIIRGLMAILLPRPNDPAELERREMVAASASTFATSQNWSCSAFAARTRERLRRDADK